MLYSFYLIISALTLILCWLVGDFLSPYLMLPPSLLGLLLMLLVLLGMRRVPLPLFDVGAFALRSMALLFIPVTVGAVAYLSELGAWIWLLFFALLSSSVISLAMTAWLAQKLKRASSSE